MHGLERGKERERDREKEREREREKEHTEGMIALPANDFVDADVCIYTTWMLGHSSITW